MTATPTERGPDSTWSRLRRRKVVQWGVAYVAASWGLLQGLQFLAGTYGWSIDVLRYLTLALALGLPIVVTLAWFHGDRDQQRVTRKECVVLTLLIVAGGAIFWIYDRTSERPAAATSTAALSATPAATISEAITTPDEKSIAVLPFADMSAARDQEYMSDGIAEELLNLLAKAPGLKVIARTSSFAFKGEKVEIAEIARRLNVAHILEGSVRTAGNKIRITAQLIRTADSTHLWSETYDRPVDDIFEVQDDVADAIAQALQIKLSGGKLSRHEGGTQNLEAYELYLRALAGVNESSKKSINEAGRYLEQAVKLDPNYASAWYLLGATIGIKAEMGLIDTIEALEQERRLQLHALELSPRLAVAHASLAGIAFQFDWDWKATEAGVKRSLELDPTGLAGRNTAGRLYTVLGRVHDAEQQYRAALVRDPLDPYLKLNLGIAYYLSRRFSESEALYRELLEEAPDFAWTRIYLGKTLLARGDPTAALAMVLSESDEPIRLLYLPIMLRAAGKLAEAEQALQAQIAEWAENGPYFVAQTYAYRGDNDLALEWLERAYRQKDTGLIEITGEPLLDNIAADARFKAFLRKMKLPEWPTQAIAATGT